MQALACDSGAERGLLLGDVTNFVGPTVFTDNAKRRITGTIHLVIAAGCLAQYAQSGNQGLLAVGLILALLGAYHFVAGWKTGINETEALAVASVGSIPSNI